MKGVGDYTVNYNTLANSSQTPQFVGSNEGVRIRHREYLGSIVSSTTFQLSKFPIQPGLFNLPWLSCVANSFEEYKFNGLVFEFRTTSGTSVGTTNTSLGSIIMATQYNAALPNFSSKTEMLNYQFSCSGVPSQNILHPVECKRDQNVFGNLFVRSSPVPPGSDVRLYDMANFQIATDGQQVGGTPLGQIWCSYDLTLMKPKIGYSPYSSWSGHYTATAGITTSAYFGNNGTNSSGNAGIISVGTNAFTLPVDAPAGYYQVTYVVRGTNLAGAAAPAFSLTNASYLNMFNGNTTNYFASGGGGAMATICLTFFMNITASPATVTFTGGTMPTSPTFVDLLVTQVSASLS